MMNSQLAPALAHHRAGRLAEAEVLYRQLLKEDPNNPDALYLMGLIALQTNRLEAAADLISRALAFKPDNAEYHANLGEVQRRLRRLPEAIASFRRATTLAPQNAGAFYNLALALSAAGDSGEAIAAYHRALAIQPKFPEALNNLGLLHHKSNDFAAAADCFHQAIALRPAAEPENNLGLALWKLNEHAEALACFTRAAQLNPKFAAAYTNLAFAHRKLGQYPEALAAYRRVTEFSPGSVENHREMAFALLECGQLEQALAVARHALALATEPGRDADTLHALGVILASCARTDPQKLPEAVAVYEQALAVRPDTGWQFELANLRGDTPTTAPDAYVKSLFDGYALRFEKHLVQELQYRVPQALLAAVLQTVKSGQSSPPPFDILDLGCGSGLCGEVFRPHARSLTGVDLSSKMVDLARDRRDPAGHPIYDHVLCTHLLNALQQYDSHYDLILAADVFIYVGALDQIFPAAARALRPKGILAFSIERHDGPGFILHHRFAHSLAYIRGLAQEFHLTEIAVQESAIRSDVPPGYLIVLQK